MDLRPSTASTLVLSRPLAAVQQVHWNVHKAFLSYQAAAEDRRQLAADTGEVIRQFVDTLVAGAGQTSRRVSPTSTNSPPAPEGARRHRRRSAK